MPPERRNRTRALVSARIARRTKWYGICCPRTMVAVRQSRWAWFCPLVLGLAAIDCSGNSKSSGGSACNTNVDCPEGQRCLTPHSQTKVAAPCVLVQACTTSAQCQGGYVCLPNTQFGGGAICPPMVCSPPCQTSGCRADQVCGASGLCEFHRCDEAGAPACAEHYRCDVAAAAAAPAAALSGSSTADTDDATRAAQRGCVRKRCDETGGFACRDYWQCDPGRATDASGCVALPCTTTEHCSDDTVYVCSPTNAGHRPDGTDANGCVLRNCGEGVACTYLRNGVNLSYCDLANPASNSNGCSTRRCDEEPKACFPTQRCAPSSRFADDVGCRPLTCEEGATCPVGYVCDVSSSASTADGCRLELGAGAGGSANVGASGSSGTSGDGSGAAGRGTGGSGASKGGMCVAAG